MITSISNEHVKNIRKLKDRKFREATLSAYVEGTRQVIEAIQQNLEIEKIILTNTFLSSVNNEKILEVLQGCEAPRMEVTKEVFSSFSLKEGPQGIGAVIRQRWTKLEEHISSFSGVWVCLWEIADPGNLGTILRTMDAVGSSGVILTGNCTDPYDPASIRSSMGAVFSKTLVKSNLEELIVAIRDHAIETIGTSDSANLHYRDARYPTDMLLLMGSERQGIPNQLRDMCSSIVNLPMLGVCDSLNLAVATGVLLYEILDQHSGRTRN